jgi:hypothetical protein
MKNNLLKTFILAFCLCSNFILFAQTVLPGYTGNGSGGVEGNDSTVPGSTGGGSGGVEGNDSTIPGSTGGGSGGVEGNDSTVLGSTGDGSGGVEGNDSTVPSSTGDGSGGVEGNDTTAVPIDTYLSILALLVILYVFLNIDPSKTRKFKVNESK